ncbi:hypothetical protein BC832DRAFT_8116 [Gaertneriomyces semiglobifer]|nr:hypothetical protein BC832DRAFT_8116 [Gaertneriomyces semiglobifer]
MSSTTSRYELATINTTVVSDHSAASTPSSCLSTWEDVSPTSITSSSPVLVAGPTVMRIHGSVKPACKVKTFVSKHAMARSVASVTQRTGDFVTIKLEGDSDHIIELRSLIEEHVRTTAPQSVVTWDEPTPDELRHPLFSGVVILPSEHSNNLRKQSNEFLTGDISTYQENDAPPRYPEVGMSATKSVGDAVKEGIKLHGAGITAAVQSAVASVLTPARAIEAVGNADIGFGAAVGGLIYTAAATPGKHITLLNRHCYTYKLMVLA